MQPSGPTGLTLPAATTPQQQHPGTQPRLHPPQQPWPHATRPLHSRMLADSQGCSLNGAAWTSPPSLLLPAMQQAGNSRRCTCQPGSTWTATLMLLLLLQQQAAHSRHR